MAIEVEVGVKAKVDDASFSDAGKKISELYKGTFDDISKYWDKTFTGLIESTGKTVQSTLGQSIMDGCSSGFDNLGKIWDSACKSMADNAKKSLADVLGGSFLGHCVMSSFVYRGDISSIFIWPSRAASTVPKLV